MKKYFRFILIMSLALCLIGCSSEKEEFEKYVKDMEEVCALDEAFVEKINVYASNPTENAYKEMEAAYNEWDSKVEEIGNNLDDSNPDTYKIAKVHKSYEILTAAVYVKMGQGIIAESMSELYEISGEYVTELKALADELDVDIDHLFE